jgi:nucleotide-binding universal stress UspA family protein
MSKPIVVGYDGSDGAKASLASAIELADRLGAELVIAYGYEFSRLGGEVTDLAAALREMGEKLTQEGAERAANAGLTTRQVVREGDPARVLADLGKELDATAIVVGTRGERPVVGLILGSLCHKILHLAQVPVLVVPVPPPD